MLKPRDAEGSNPSQATMNEQTETKEDPIVPVCQWEFDSYSSKHWEEKRAGEVKETRSWVELADTDYGQQVTVVRDTKEVCQIQADRDQWGTWISFQIGDKGFTIAQEDGTMSFLDALIAGLTKLKDLTFETTPPLLKDLKQDAVPDVVSSESGREENL